MTDDPAAIAALEGLVEAYRSSREQASTLPPPPGYLIREGYSPWKNFGDLPQEACRITGEYNPEVDHREGPKVEVLQGGASSRHDCLIRCWCDVADRIIEAARRRRLAAALEDVG